MSNETRDFNNYQYTSSYNHYNNNNNQNINNLPNYVSSPSTYNANMISSNTSPQGAYELGFEFSPSSTEFFKSLIDQENGIYNNNYNNNNNNNNNCNKSTHEVGGGAIIECETRVSASPSSSEVDHRPGEDSGKNQRKREGGDGGEDDQRSQKICKTKKKEEKKQKEPRVSFMTKTEVDHLEDGYRWRKYGQKAVKNSPYPRSYYRCTTQKCNVKKRVERSYQDPTVVITTYESQHNHPIPTNRRTSMFSTPAASDNYNNSSTSSPIFSDLIINTPRNFSRDDLFRAPYASHANHVNPSFHHQQQQNQEFRHHESDYELLKEMFPSVFFKQET